MALNIIKKYFDPKYNRSSVRWLIDQGNLSDYRLFAVPSINRDDIDVSDIVDVLECEVFDLELKSINERMYNIMSEEE